MSKYQNIVYGQLLSIVYNMIEFKISIESIKEFIDSNSKKFNLNEDFYQAVVVTINELNNNLKLQNEGEIRENLFDDNKLTNLLEVSIK